MKNAKMRTGIILGVIVLLVLIVGAGAVTVVPAGHTGVVVTMGKVSDRVLDEGMHFKLPFVQQVVMMNNKIQKTEIDSNGVSKDLQTVSSGVAINYHINKDDSAVIYRTIGEGYADTVLQPAIQESMKAITAQYTAEELITKRSAVGEEIGATLAEKVQEYGILIDKFNILTSLRSSTTPSSRNRWQSRTSSVPRPKRNRRSLRHRRMRSKRSSPPRQRRTPSGRKPRQRQTPTRRSTHR